MIHINRKTISPEWDDWLSKVPEETNKVIDAINQGNKPKFKDSVWKDFKPYLEEIFHNKCGYCETSISSGAWMAVEHYRPKGKITYDKNPNNIVKIRDPNNQEIPHPGYYWLAYDWKNYVLSCNKCNSPPGKGNQFPIEGNRACRPFDSLDTEKPLLLNPFNDNPQEHLKIGKFGHLVGKTDRGRETIRICNLNREELNTARQLAFARDKYWIFNNYLNNTSTECISNDLPFSFYLKEAAKEFLKEILALLNN